MSDTPEDDRFLARLLAAIVLKTGGKVTVTPDDMRSIDGDDDAEGQA